MVTVQSYALSAMWPNKFKEKWGKRLKYMKYLVDKWEMPNFAPMNTTEATQRLEHKGIKATANRILVYRELARHGRPMSLADMENSMPQMDKSSIFRVLSLFLDHDVVHTFTDGRGVQNYELCHDDGACHHDDGHLHFYCEMCHRSFCLDDVPLPEIELPEGYAPRSVSFVIMGECPDCRKARL